MNNVNIDRIVVSLRFLLVKKVLNIFLGTKFMPMCIILAKMNAIRRDFEETKYVFLLKDNKLLKNTIKLGIKSARLLKSI